MKSFSGIAIYILALLVAGFLFAYLLPVQFGFVFNLKNLLISFGLLSFGSIIGAGIMACLAAGKYDDMQNNRIDG